MLFSLKFEKKFHSKTLDFFYWFIIKCSITGVNRPPLIARSCPKLSQVDVRHYGNFCESDRKIDLTIFQNDENLITVNEAG